MTAQPAPLTKVKLTVDHFDLLGETGALAGLERSELLDGDIYLMAAQYTRHALAKSIIHEALLDWKRVHRPELVVLTEASVAIPPSDEPMPDVNLTQRPGGRKAVAIDGVLLLVEVADESRGNDLGYKAELYARAGVPEYWVVDLPQRRVVRHCEPGGSGYARIDPFAFGESVVSLTLAALTVATDDLSEAG